MNMRGELRAYNFSRGLYHSAGTCSKGLFLKVFINDEVARGMLSRTCCERVDGFGVLPTPEVAMRRKCAAGNTTDTTLLLMPGLWLILINSDNWIIEGGMAMLARCSDGSAR
jgi:hypothetical protein